MRNILFLAVCVLTATTQVQAKAKYEPECKISGFDSVNICSVRTYGVYVFDKKTTLSSVAFGGLWISSDPENVSLIINLGDIAANVDHVSFNTDGVIDTFKAYPTSNRVARTGNLRSTSSAISIPTAYLEKMLNAKELKYRIATISSGYREGSFYSKDGVAAEPINTLKALLSKAKNR